jgi:hypothetical protein
MTALTMALGALIAASSPQAQAAPPSKSEVAEAHRRFQRATELYEENNLAGALAEFRRAYGLAPNYKVLYNIGQLCDQLQDYPCAFTSFSRYLAEGGGEVPADRREEVQREITRLQSRLAKLRVIADKPGAEVTVDDVAVGRTPLAEPVLVNAGRPRVRVALTGYEPVTRVVEVAGMETATVQVELVSDTPLQAAARPLAVSGRDSGPHASGPTPVAPWVITGVLAAAAGVTGGLALWSSSDLKKRRTEIDASPAELDHKSSRTKRLALATDILIGGAAVSAVVATYMTVSRPSRSEGVALVLTPGGFLLSGAF